MTDGRPRAPHPGPTLVLGVALVLITAAGGAALRPAEVPPSAGPPDETVVYEVTLSVAPPGPSAAVSMADVVRHACDGLVDADAAVLRARATTGDERAASLTAARGHVLEVRDDLRWDEDVVEALDAYAAVLEDGDLDAVSPFRGEAHEACGEAAADPG